MQAFLEPEVFEGAVTLARPGTTSAARQLRLVGARRSEEPSEHRRRCAALISDAMIHEAAGTGFERAAEQYERGRPDYPSDAIDWLVEQLDLAPGRVVLDVGAGTGKLTRALLPSGAEVVAVEPVAAMREVLHRETPTVRALDGSAERLPLDYASADAVVAGQAFHWFDGSRALTEFHRVLRPDGRLGLIWNRKRGEQPLHRAIDTIIEPFRRGTPSHRSGAWRAALERSSLFEPAGEMVLPLEQGLDRDQLVDRVASISFIAALDERQRHDVLERVRQLAVPERLSLSYSCEVFVFRRRPRLR
jgi:SAM-dependent methyltransferase